MGTARSLVSKLASQIAAMFLESGNFVYAGPHGPGMIAATALDVVEPSLFSRDRFEERGFSGLSVQSVGFEVSDVTQKVHVYVTRGARSKIIEEVSTKEGLIQIQINRMGKVIVRPEAAKSATNRGNLYQRKKRITCGSSCAPAGEYYAGTLGAIVRKKDRADLYILSNNHVLAACNHVPIDMPILAPSTIDAAPSVIAPREIARHSDICELRSGIPTLVPPAQEDVALARVTDPSLISSWQGDDNSGYDTPRTISKPAFGQSVKKFGRTTGLTHGRIEARINNPTPIPYRSRFFTATVWFSECWTVRALGDPFALPGDSGSLVIDADGEAAVGLVFAVNPAGDYAFIIPMDHIATKFGGIELVSGHGI